MMNVALIPARGGSKSIPKKNIKDFNGEPLIYWVIKAAQECDYIDMIYVATDNKEIKKTIDMFKFDKLVVIGRSEESATDNASTEMLMLEFAQKFIFDNIILIQATSPLLLSEDLNKGFQIFFLDDTDSVVSVVEHKRFTWNNDEDGYINPENYDIYNRPRRQEMKGNYIENGAFYITSRDNLLSSGCRISGKIRGSEMNSLTYWEIDEPLDWSIVEKLHTMANCYNIKLFLTDCDGCLTDGGMYYCENGLEMKKFNAVDGMGFELLKRKGIKTGIITSENSSLLYKRAEKLHVDYLCLDVDDKLKKVEEICKKLKIGLENVAYVGDDINDLQVMKKVGYACSVKNAMHEIKEISKYVSKYQGGNGAVRDCINKILKDIC